MDLIDINQIFGLLKVDSGHGLVQSLILLGIWFNTRGVKREVVSLKESVVGLDKRIERLDSIEAGINNLNIRLVKVEGVK